LLSYFHRYFRRYVAGNGDSYLPSSLPGNMHRSLPSSIPGSSPHSFPDSFPNHHADDFAGRSQSFLASSEGGCGVRRNRVCVPDHGHDSHQLRMPRTTPVETPGNSAGPDVGRGGSCGTRAILPDTQARIRR